MILEKNYNICDSEKKKETEQIYLSSFPKEERFDFNILVECSKETSSKLNTIILNDKTIGMSFIVNYNDNNQNITYLMYLAIDKKYRNKGYASLYLKELVNNNSNILLCIERPNYEYEATIKRLSFYLKNGFYNTNKYFEDTGVEYLILSSQKDYIPTKEVMLKRYNSMSKKDDIIKNIKNTFNTQNITFY